MNGSKPIFKSRIFFTILAALLVPEVFEVIGLMWNAGLIEAIKTYISDFELSLDEIIQIALFFLGIFFRLDTTKTAYLSLPFGYVVGRGVPRPSRKE